MPTPDTRLRTLDRFTVVIVTGGSSGIGCSFIKAILNVLPDVVLCNLSRSKPEIFLGKNGRHITTDLSKTDSVKRSAGELIEVISDAPAGEVLLVNNSGFGDYGQIQNLNSNKQLEMLDLNIRAVVDLTTRLLPTIQARGGVIMNIASTAAFQPTPFLATYGASKAFVMHWSLAINEDLKGSGVRCMAICPGPTRSNFFKRAGFETPPMGSGPGDGFLDMTADQVAQMSLLGLVRGKTLVVTGWQNRLITILSSMLPRVLLTNLAARILRKLRLEKHSQSKS